MKPNWLFIGPNGNQPIYLLRWLGSWDYGLTHYIYGPIGRLLCILGFGVYKKLKYNENE